MISVPILDVLNEESVDKIDHFTLSFCYSLQTGNQGTGINHGTYIGWELRKQWSEIGIFVCIRHLFRYLAVDLVTSKRALRVLSYHLI